MLTVEQIKEARLCKLLDKLTFEIYLANRWKTGEMTWREVRQIASFSGLDFDIVSMWGCKNDRK